MRVLDFGDLSEADFIARCKASRPRNPFREAMAERPGPVALLRRAAELYDSAEARGADLEAAASLVTRYAKKADGRPTGGHVVVIDGDGRTESFHEPLVDETFRGWII